MTDEELRLLLGLVVGTVVNGHQWLSHSHRLAGLGTQLRHGPGERAGEFDDRLGRLDLAQHVVDLDGVTGRHPPGDDLSLGEPFARVGHAVVLHVNASQNQKARERSTASRMRSTSGMCSPSALAGG